MSRSERATAFRPLPDLPPGTIAVGWATVELDRAARELAGHLVPGGGFTNGSSSIALGARTRIGRTGLPDGRVVWLVLMEPETEGILAATLARADEGWAAIWAQAGSAIVPPAVSVARPGPFGMERIVLGGPIAGPHRLLVEAATIPA